MLCPEGDKTPLRLSQVPRLQKAHDGPRMRETPAQVRLGSRRHMLCPKPSHGQTLPLRYTAHIVAGPVFDDILAAPAGGF